MTRDTKTTPGRDSAARPSIRGTVVTFGDHVNTDVIIPGRYLVSIDPEELAEHAFEPLGPEVQARLHASDVVVAGRNFGCGSAREQAATALLGAGIKAVIAVSFARVFFRNAINTALPVIEAPDAVALLGDGDEIEIDTDGGVVRARGREVQFDRYPDVVQRILDAGGLIPHVREQLDSQAATED